MLRQIFRRENSEALVVLPRAVMFKAMAGPWAARTDA